MAEVKRKMNHMLDYSLLEQLEHGMLVASLAVSLAKRLGCGEQLVQDIGLAGLVHDIGKTRLSRYVEDGRDTMTVEEIKYVRMHSMFSAEILRRKGFSERVCEMVLYHHENADGSGYPKNLHGDEIPLGSKILRVCDVYAALISHRPYRSAFDKRTAITLMIEEVKNFDMKIFLVFQQMIHEEEFGRPELLSSLPEGEQRELVCDILNMRR